LRLASCRGLPAWNPTVVRQLALSALVGCALCVISGETSAGFTGSIETSIVTGVQTPSNALVFQELETDILVALDLGGLNVASSSSLSMTGYESQTFTATMTVDLWQFCTELGFTPLHGGFDHWLGTASIDLGGALVGTTLYLAQDPIMSYGTLSLSGAVGAGTVALKTKFEGCSLSFSQCDLTATGFEICGASLSSSMRLSESGFEDLRFSASGIPLPGFALATLDAALRFTVMQKTLNLSVSWEGLLEPLPCLTLYTAIAGGAGGSSASLGAIEVYGLGVNCTVGAVSVSSVSVLDPAYAASVLGIGHANQWDLLRLSTKGSDCCEHELSWTISTYFSAASTALFDWSETIAALTIPVAAIGSVTVSFDVSELGLEELSFSLKLDWGS
jgi:hypothetical protein